MFDRQTKFLIVDDFQTIRSMLAEIIRGMSFSNIVEAENGKEAWNLLVSGHENDDPVGFIIADWNMPIMSGVELLEKRSEDTRFSKIPFLMVTIESELSFVMKAVSLGINDFVVKPFSQKTIELKIETIYDKLFKNQM